jgi:hypothetical protein
VSGAGVKVCERRNREGGSIAYRGRPLEGRKPRRASAAVFGLTVGTAGTDSLEEQTPEGGRTGRSSAVGGFAAGGRAQTGRKRQEGSGRREAFRISVREKL